MKLQKIKGFYFPSKKVKVNTTIKSFGNKLKDDFGMFFFDHHKKEIICKK